MFAKLKLVSRKVPVSSIASSFVLKSRRDFAAASPPKPRREFENQSDTRARRFEERAPSPRRGEERCIFFGTSGLAGATAHAFFFFFFFYCIADECCTCASMAAVSCILLFLRLLFLCLYSSWVRKAHNSITASYPAVFLLRRKACAKVAAYSSIPGNLGLCVTVRCARAPLKNVRTSTLPRNT